jgi:hypothetical protein
MNGKPRASRYDLHVHGSWHASHEEVNPMDLQARGFERDGQILVIELYRANVTLG